MKKLALFLFAFSIPASAQLGNVTLKHFAGVPSGACARNQQALNDATADLYTCLSGAWHAAGTSTGTGTLTNFSAGTGAPLFTTNVATPTTTPALTFTASNAAANTVFGNFTGAPAAPTFTAAPTFSAANLTNFPTFNQNTTGTAAALTATPTNCGAGSAAIGILANGNATGCFTPSGAGTVTTFSAGNLSPLFTSSVATATSTPALTFTLSTPAANTVFGNFTGAPAAPTFTAAPTFSAANLTSFPTFNQNTTGTASNLSGTPALPNGTTATTQTAGDNTTKIATDAFVIANSSGSLPSGPTSPNGVPSVLTSTPSGGVAGAAAYSLGGVPVNNNSETTCATQTLNVLDRATSIFCSGGSTSTFTLPVHTTSGFGVNFPMVIYNGNSGNMTLTPTTDTIDRGTLLPSWAVFAYNNASGNWQSNQFPTYNAFGTTCTNGSTWSTTTGFGCLSAAPVKSGDAAGGDLTGTYPNPTITTNAVTQTKVLNGYVDLSSTQASIAGAKTFTGNTTMTAGQNSIVTSTLNGKIMVDCVKYACNATGVQQAINDAVTNNSFEVDLPCGSAGDMAINTTLTITHSPFYLHGCSGGDFNDNDTAAYSRFIYTGSAGSDVLDIGPQATGRQAGIRIDNLFIDGQGLARYDLKTVHMDTMFVENVKLNAGATANWYHADATGTVAINVQLTCEQTGDAGLVLDWGSALFLGMEIAFDTGSCAASTNTLLWIGGGGNRSIHFVGGQINENTATPVGFIKVTGYDTTSPWAGVPTGTVAGAPTNLTFDGIDLTYGAGAPVPASQGGDILVDGTTTNPPNGVTFENCSLSGAGASGGAAVGVKIDHATNVQFINCSSTGHTSGAASTLTTTANTSNVYTLWVKKGTDTNLYSGTTPPFASFTPTNFQIDKDANITLPGGTAVTGTPPTLSVPTGWFINAGGNNNMVFNTSSTQFYRTLTPAVSGGTDVGSTALPFGSVWIGGSATNNIKLTGTATGSRTATLPDATGTIALLDNFTFTGTAPGSVSTTPGTAANPLLNWIAAAGGATTNASGTGGAGGGVNLTAGAGGAASGATASTGGTGGGFALTAGNGGAGAGTGVNSNGGGFTFNVGQPGTGGSGTAGKTGILQTADSGGHAGFIFYAQGTANTTANANVPANSIIEEAPTAVTAYKTILPGAAATGVQINVNASGVITQNRSGSFGAVSQTAKTAAVTTFTVCAATANTACGQAGQYRLTYNVWGSGTACSAVTVGSVVLNLTWTDENAVTHTTINAPMWDQKTAAMTSGQTNFNTALGTEGGSGSFIISTNGTIIQAATTYTACTTGTGTYNVRITTEQLQ